MKDEKTTIGELKNILAQFRDERDWLQFHNPKDLAESINIEASELLELFLWKSPEEIEKRGVDREYRKKISDELADVMIGCINFANALDIDISTSIENKVQDNSNRYPVEKAKGKAYKYSDDN